MNFIVTCPRNFESEAIDEIKTILDQINNKNSIIRKTEFSGILEVQTNIDIQEVIKKVKEKIADEPWVLRYSLRWIPIQVEVNSNIIEISNQAYDLIGIIKENDSYRITIEKRNSDISSNELIKNIASKIKNKVSLEHPDWIILVEILGKKTGISVIKPDEIISIEKQKRIVSE